MTYFSLDLHHHVFLLLCNGRLTFAPIISPKYILDVGTGTGIWAQDAAEYIFPFCI
jgi:ubiquinone/menaquinone biosynthesis C-methylase UbiE